MYMLEISQYDFSDNPNIPRIIDSVKRDFGIDLELDFTIEQIGDCLRLIGKPYYSGEVPADKNGFPLIKTEKQYYACMYFIVWKYELRKSFTGTFDVNRFQIITQLKDRYINQARVLMTNTDMREASDIWRGLFK